MIRYIWCCNMYVSCNPDDWIHNIQLWGILQVLLAVVYHSVSTASPGWSDAMAFFFLPSKTRVWTQISVITLSSTSFFSIPLKQGLWPNRSGMCCYGQQAVGWSCDSQISDDDGAREAGLPVPRATSPRVSTYQTVQTVAGKLHHKKRG